MQVTMERRETNYGERQEAWVRENNLEAGDKVKVVLNCMEPEWKIYREELDRLIGFEFIVKDIPQGGISLCELTKLVPYSMLKKIKSFKPFTFEIHVESEDELRLLWHRFNTPINSLHKSSSMSFPETDEDDCVWLLIDEACMKFGVK
jgi:hypothetical protein